jgi:hypothetical protein
MTAENPGKPDDSAPAQPRELQPGNTTPPDPTKLVAALIRERFAVGR